MSNSTPPSRQLSPSGLEGRAKTPSRYSSRAPSRLRNSRNSSRAPYTPGPESLLLPDGPIDEDTAELLHEFVHPHHRDTEGSLFNDNGGEDQDDESDTSSFDLLQKLPWYKRPSPLWFLVFVPLAAAAAGATLAPKIEIFTRLVCEVYRPEYTIGRGNDTRPAILGSSVIGFATDDDTRHCASDPVVQAEVAKLTMAMTASLGVLSCLTTAWWGALSDRYGRTRILSVCIFGLVVTDVTFLIVSRFHSVLPGGYWFILVGPLFDGLLGGITACTAAVHAYVADCTEAGSRSRVFSLIMGLMFIGIGIGPTLGSVVTHWTGSPLSVFYIATLLHVIYAALVSTIVPESLTIRRMMESRRSHAEALAAARRAPQKKGLVSSFKKIFGFMSPLSLFYPTSANPDSNPLKCSKKDWNLALLAISFGCTVSVVGTFNYKFQYAAATFGWTSEENGYWLSIVGFTRAIYLTAILPVIIKLLKPKPKPPVQLPSSPDEPLLPSASPSSPEQPHASSPATTKSNSHVLSFDLWLARGSLVVEILAYTLIPFASTAKLYTIFGMMSALGSGYSPAVQSVALGLYTQQGGTESGKLFGALSVVQALSSQVIGPAVYGATYLATVATFPTAIFFMTASAVTIAFVTLSFVRLQEPRQGDLEGPAGIPTASGSGEQEDSLPDADIPIIVVEAANPKSSSSSV